MKQQELTDSIYALKLQLAQQWPGDTTVFNGVVSFLENQRSHYLKSAILAAIKNASPTPIRNRPNTCMVKNVSNGEVSHMKFNLSEHLAESFARELISEGIFAKDFVCEKIENRYGYDLILRFNI